jgi:hypothetical protein
VEQLEAIRAPGSENAAPWLHLLAASVVAMVVIPRLVLGLVAGIIERYRATRVAIPLGEAYYQRLLRGFRGGPVRVRVIPYSYAVPPAALAGLETIVRARLAATLRRGVAGFLRRRGRLPSGRRSMASPVIACSTQATPEPRRMASSSKRRRSRFRKHRSSGRRICVSHALAGR